MSTINFVRYYLHKNNLPATEVRMRQLIALAYQTAREKELYPQAVFVRYVTKLMKTLFKLTAAGENRSDVHLTTTINGKTPKGSSGTSCNI